MEKLKLQNDVFIETVKATYKKQLIDIIHKRLPGCKIYLFGSRATKRHRANSDIDLALDCGKPIEYNTIIALLCDIDDTTIPMKIDLVDLQAPIQDELRKNIDQEGVLWTN